MPFSIPFLSLQRVLLLNSFPGLDMLLTSKFFLFKNNAFSLFLPSLLFYPIFYHIFGPCPISPWLGPPLALMMDPPKLQPSLSHAPPSGFLQVPQLRTYQVGGWSSTSSPFPPSGLLQMPQLGPPWLQTPSLRLCSTIDWIWFRHDGPVLLLLQAFLLLEGGLL